MTPGLTKAGLIAFAGYDRRETAPGPSAKTLAVMATRSTINRYSKRRWRARIDPPSPARGDFPYFVKEQQA